MPLDETNRKILEVLTKDARISYTDLARIVGRAESTVRERVGALERRGVIEGYQAIVNPLEVGFTARGFVRGSFDLRKMKELEQALQAIPQVRRAVLTTGAHPVVVEISAQGLTDFENVLEKRLAPLELSNMETDLFVREILPERPVLSPSSTTVRVHNGDHDVTGDGRLGPLNTPVATFTPRF